MPSALSAPALTVTLPPFSALCANFNSAAIIDPQPSRQRDLVVAMIAARILDPASKLATARGLHSDTLHSSLGESLALDSADETELYSAMDWLLQRQPRIERGTGQT